MMLRSIFVLENKILLSHFSFNQEFARCDDHKSQTIGVPLCRKLYT